MSESLIRISNTLNLTKQEFTALEKHILLVTLLKLKARQGFNIDSEDNNETLQIDFPATELKETNVLRIKEALDKITSRKIFFSENTKDDEYFGYMVPFTYAKYASVKKISSTISLELNRRAKRLFLELAHGYTTTDLNAVISLKSVHAIRMYELLMMHKDYGTKDSKGEWVVELEELKRLLGLEDSSYSKSFTDFEKRILIYAQKELKANCNLEFEWTIEAKERKKIKSLRFFIRTLEESGTEQLETKIRDTFSFLEELPKGELAAKVHSVMRDYTFSASQQKRILNDPELLKEFIRLDITIGDMMAKGKKIESKTRYMAKSLKLKGM